MQAFAFSKPASVAEATAAAAAGAQLLAGGQSLLPAMKLGLAAPGALADLGAIAVGANCEQDPERMLPLPLSAEASSAS